jgi:prophage regulatory protein
MNARQIDRPSVVSVQLGIAVSTLYDWTTPSSPRFDPDFPKKIRFGRRAVGFNPAEVAEWLAKKAGAR